LATPLVVSVHTVVSFDFAVSILPGWHTTIFPPYFVAGAIYSGFAMVLSLMIPTRAFFHLEDFITMRHLQTMAKVMLGVGLIVGYGYLMEIFIAWYSADSPERFMVVNRMTGPYAPLYWALILCNILAPQVLWSRRVRSNPVSLFIISIVINIGMWLERFVIVITSLHRDFLPSSWREYYPTFWDWSVYLGTIGFFLTAMFLFIRVLPVISIAEMRTVVQEAEPATEVAH
jgi:Ni/Fe-hydrogenase subunit HybB-like protein